MNEWSGQAVILRRGQFHESDMWIKALCRERGLATIFAFGGYVSRRRFCGCLDIFNTLACRIRISRNGQYLDLCEASLVEGPKKLRRDWKRMGIAANCLLFMEALNISSDNANACFDLVEDLRSTLERGATTSLLTPQFFRLRAAALMGFAPTFSLCGSCGNALSRDAIFSVDGGVPICPSCSAKTPLNRFHVPVTRRVLDILGIVRESSPHDWKEPSLESYEKRACARIIDGFIQYHLGLEWDNGFFRHV